MHVQLKHNVGLSLIIMYYEMKLNLKLILEHALKKKNTSHGVSVVVQQKPIQLGTMRLLVPFLASLCGLRILCRHELWCRSQTWLRFHVAVAVV